MGKTAMYLIVTLCAVINFIIPVIQLSIGFSYIVEDGSDPNKQCASAPDLPLLMAIGGVFALIFIGIGYGFIKMISAPSKHESDVAGTAPKLLVCLSSFFFGAITLIFFILIQIRVYGAYSYGFQTHDSTRNDFCKSAVMNGALAIVILTYINMFIFIGVLMFFLIRRAI